MSGQISELRETAFAFDCEGSSLIGFIHEGNPSNDIGILTITPGGPQCRIGVGRQLVRLARRLAAEGVTVMRFDHRGLGDSEGSFRGFQDTHNDIAAAIDEFQRRLPSIRRVILWGGCDAASAALLNAYKLPAVVCVIAGNPFVSSPVTAAKAQRKHYLSRLKQKSFWVKLLKLEYNPKEYAAGALQKLKRKSAPNKEASADTSERKSHPQGNFVENILTGLRKFNGRILFLMGDRFLLSTEFDQLVVSTPEWRAAYNKPGYERIDIKGGDQVFSNQESQERMFDAASQWIHKTFTNSADQGPVT